MKQSLIALSLAVMLQASPGAAQEKAAKKAPELDGGVGWFNTDKPVRLEELKGKIVLLDFWTFCCINCMHVIPDLIRLEKKYPKELVVIGVHSAKFANEKDSDAIRQAILRYDIEHPVVNDADFKIWNKYGARGWPHFTLIDPEGNIVGHASGEGQYETFVKAIDATIKKFEGKINRTDPYHLIFSIWATTQHYADFDVQVRAVLGKDRGGEGRFEDAARYLENLFMDGLRPKA